jgi:integrase
LAEWIRANGFTDKRKAPNHAFRHWFKSACQRAGVLDSVADAIQGHSGIRGEADGYRHSGVAVMAEAIAKIQVPAVDAGGMRGDNLVREPEAALVLNSISTDSGG